MKKKIVSFALALVMALSLIPAFSPLTVNAAEVETGYIEVVALTTGSRTFTATLQNRPMLTSSGAETRSSEAMFQLSGLPATARITRIEVMPGGASMSGATVVPRSWRVRSSHNVQQDIQLIGPSGGTHTFNGLNGTLANGNFFVSFTGIAMPTPGLIGMPPLTTGTMSYNSLRLIVHFQS